ncbi:BSD domain-containing protein [Actinidia rufa]|uniref:BSD domain-containing protein n=1 Tax=Actinidia rufa TaxID=165716 RepID=A0A7J0H7T8_9ERIC|nr:BSD domain-containing protein [Actinidia rufa]
MLCRQILKARASLTQELQNRTKLKPEQDWSRGDMPCSNDISNTPAIKPATSLVDADFETEKHPVQSTEIPIIDKSVIEEGPVSHAKEQNLHSDSPSRVLEEKYDDDWLKEESSEIIDTGRTTIPIENAEDVSFSDLEEDDGDVPKSDKKVAYGSDSSVKESQDWVQLSRTSVDSTKDTNAVGLVRARTEPVSSHNPDMKESKDWLDIDEIDADNVPS